MTGDAATGDGAGGDGAGDAVAGEAAGTAPPYLAGLRLAGRRVVVVGGGAVAARRVPALLRAGAAVTVVAPELAASLRRLVADGAVTGLARRYRSGDLAAAWYVLATTDDPAVNREVAAEAEALRVFCVRADDASAATALTPATGEHGGLLVGVLSSGAPSAPRRAAAARDAALAALRSLPPPG